MPFDRIGDAVRPERRRGPPDPRGPAHLCRRRIPLWQDLGAWWLEETGLPLPLAVNVVRRDLGADGHGPGGPGPRASIEYGLAQSGPALAHASRYNRGIGEEKTDRFVGMYVNQWTVDYGPRGRAASAAAGPGPRGGIIPERVRVEFVG
jgi:1,4-dihydroxy-6-naphthoate synthase